MEFEIAEGPSHAVLEVTLAEGEQIEATPGAMMTRSGETAIETAVGGSEGIEGAVKGAIGDGQGLVKNTFHAQGDDATVSLVPRHPGDVVPLNVSQTGPLTVQSGALLAWEPLVERSTKLDDAGNFLAAGELTVLGVAGQGWVFLAPHGAVRERTVSPDEPVVADEDHVVAWTDGLRLSRQKDGSLKSTALGGERFVTKFTGDGQVWLQTRDPRALADPSTA